MKRRALFYKKALILVFPVLLAGCATTEPHPYFEPNMDFASLQSVAVMPFQNLTGQDDAAERVRDTFMGMLLATEAIYVIPPGEVARGIARAGGVGLEGPTSEQVEKLSGILEVDAVITGVLKEYGAVRSGTASANVISLSLQMIESGSGRVVWSASSTKGGITVWDRLLGGGGEPMNTVTEDVVDDLLDKLFQ
jgi:hypothetical protein